MARKRGGHGVVRLGASLEPELLARLDRWVRARNSSSRSDALRALIRKELTVEDLADPAADAVATVTLLYRHDQSGVLRRLTAEQHRWGDHIRFTSHTHLENEACLEVIALVGRRAEVIAAAEDLRGVRGILFGEYTVASPRIAGGGSGHVHPHPTGPAPKPPAASRRSKGLSPR